MRRLGLLLENADDVDLLVDELATTKDLVRANDVVVLRLFSQVVAFTNEWKWSLASFGADFLDSRHLVGLEL